MRITKIIDNTASNMAHYMNGRIREELGKGMHDYPEIPRVKEISRNRRRQPASRGKDIVLIDTGLLLKRTHTIKLGRRESVVTNTDERAPHLFFGVPEKNLPARDVFEAVIKKELQADKDMEIIEKQLDKFEQEFVNRK